MAPERITRVRAELPPGYEAGVADGFGSPADFWGFRGSWTADPPECAALLTPGDAARSRGISGSGPGGTVYVVVTGGAPTPDPALSPQCGNWTVSNGQSSAAVSDLEGPGIAGADTLGMSAAIRTVVESGTVTETIAHNYIAHLDGHTVFVAVIVDPGSSRLPLDPQFGADLLAVSVAVLRG